MPSEEADLLEIDISEPIVDVITVEPKEFSAALSSIESIPSVQVSPGEWVETDGNTAIKNVGAAPCTEFFATNENGRIISGHFQETQADKYNTPELDDSVNSYRGMVARISDWAKDSKVEVHMFGNANSGTKMDLEKRAAVLEDLKNAGVNETNIDDRRIQGHQSVDSTLYLPDKGILHKRVS